MADETISQPASTRPPKGLLRSKSLWIAIVITLIGAAWWGYASASAKEEPANVGRISSLVEQSSAPRIQPARAEPPAAFRYGASFVGAFLAAYVLKKLVRSVLLIAALLVGAILLLKYLGIVNYDWEGAQKHVEQGVDIARTEGEKYRALIMGYLPSSLAGGAGAIFGARRG